MIQAGRISQTNLMSKGSAKRELLDTILEDSLTKAHEKGDLKAVASLAKVYGSQVHVQAYAKAQEATDTTTLSLLESVSGFFSELSDSGITIDVVSQSVETMQVVENKAVESKPALIEAGDEALEDSAEPDGKPAHA
jgi:hypothetical protein